MTVWVGLSVLTLLATWTDDDPYLDDGFVDEGVEAPAGDGTVAEVSNPADGPVETDVSSLGKHISRRPGKGSGDRT